MGAPRRRSPPAPPWLLLAAAALWRCGEGAPDEAVTDWEAAPVAAPTARLARLRDRVTGTLRTIEQAARLPAAATRADSLHSLGERLDGLRRVATGSAPAPPTAPPTPAGDPPAAARRMREAVAAARAAGQDLVVYPARYGLGNRIGGLLQAAAQAAAIGARLHVVWQPLPECDAPWESLFEPPRDLLSVEPADSPLTADLTVAPPVLAEADLALASPPYYPATALWTHSNELRLNSADAARADWGGADTADHSGVSVLAQHASALGDPAAEQRALGQLKRVYRQLPIRFRQARDLDRVRAGEATPLAQWARRSRARQGRPVSLIYHTDRANADPAALAAAAARYGIRPAREIAVRAANFAGEEGVNAEVVGVHLRSTDVREPLDPGRVARDLRRRYPGRRLFVCSDDEAAEKQLAREFQALRLPKAAYVSKADSSRPWRIQGGSAECNCTFNYQRSAASVRDALADLLVLARTEQPSPALDGTVAHSTFRLAATWLKDAALLGNPDDE